MLNLDHVRWRLYADRIHWRDRIIAASHRVVFFRFAVTSLIGTAIDFLLLWLCVSVVGLAVLPAKLLASEGTILNSFVWNERWTFAGRAATYSLPRRLISFHGAYAGSLALSLTVVGVGVAVWGQHVYLLANAAALPLNFLWTYAVSNWVIWRRGTEPIRGQISPKTPVLSFTQDEGERQSKAGK